MKFNERLYLLIIILVLVSIMFVLRVNGLRDAAASESPPSDQTHDVFDSKQTDVINLPKHMDITSADPMVRHRTIFAYARIIRASKKLEARIVNAAQHDESDLVRSTAINALVALKAYQKIDLFLGAMSDASVNVRISAFVAFKKIYGLSPACTSDDPLAKRQKAIAELKLIRDDVLAKARRFYERPRRLHPSKSPVIGPDLDGHVGADSI